MSKISFSGYILFIIFGVFMLFGVGIFPYLIHGLEKYIPCLIIQSILMIFLIVLILIYTVEIIYKNKIFELSENIPRYLIDDIDTMRETNAYKRIWICLGIVVFQIPFFNIIICLIKIKRHEENIAQKKIKEEALNFDETDITPEDFKYNQSSGIELYKKT